MFFDWAYETVIQYPKHPEVHDVYHYPKPPGPAKVDLAPEYLKESKPAWYDESVLDMLRRYATTIDEIVPKGLHPVTNKALPRFDLVLLDLDANGSVGGLTTVELESDSNDYLQLVTDTSPSYFTTALPLLETASNVFVFVDPVSATTARVAAGEEQEQDMADVFERILKPTTPADLKLPAARLYQGRQGNVEFFVHLGIHKRL